MEAIYSFLCDDLGLEVKWFHENSFEQEFTFEGEVLRERVTADAVFISNVTITVECGNGVDEDGLIWWYQDVYAYDTTTEEEFGFEFKDVTELKEELKSYRIQF